MLFCLRKCRAACTRNLSIDRFRYLHREKRNKDLEIAFSELEACIPIPEDRAEELAAHLNHFLRTQEKLDRILFVGRYFHASSVHTLARESGLSENNVSVRLHRTRERLRAYLMERGYSI